ncbi:MAG: hypothetical protein HY659_11660 [Rhizobiales bacterium]|nr:hypothetical protein [Hyphomicrobiales bacterium]
MTDRFRSDAVIRPAIRGRWVIFFAGVFVVAFGCGTSAQQAPPAQQPIPQAQQQPPAAQQLPPQAPVAQSAAPKKDPGFLEQLGQWFEKSAEEFNASMKKSADEFNANMKKAGRSLSEIGDRAGDAAKEATDAMARLSSTRVVSGNERCVLAPNGSPDCRAAAETICKAKGFATGQSLDTQSARKCPVRVWLSGRAPADGDCAIETYVTRAACQEPQPR